MPESPLKWASGAEPLRCPQSGDGGYHLASALRACGGRGLVTRHRLGYGKRDWALSYSIRLGKVRSVGANRRLGLDYAIRCKRLGVGGWGHYPRNEFLASDFCLGSRGFEPGSRKVREIALLGKTRFRG